MTIPEQTKTFFEDILASHVRHLRNNTVQNEVNIGKLEITEDVIHILNRVRDENNTRFDKIKIADEVDRIIKNAEKCLRISPSDSELLVYDFLKKLYDLTNQTEKQSCINYLLRNYFQDIQKDLCITEEEFRKLQKLFLPYIKMESLVETLKKGISPTETLLEEIFECLFFPQLLRENCYQIVFNKIKSNNYTFRHFEMMPLTEGKGFLGDYFKLKITIYRDNLEEVFDFFSKYLSTRNKTAETLARNSFKKEQFFYQELIPLLRKFGIGDLSNFVPEYFISLKNDAIILEDMQVLGYNCSDLKVPKDYNWIVMVIKQLSRFHACSILLDQKLSEEAKKETKVGDVFKEYLTEINFDKHTADGQMMYFGSTLISDYFVEKLSDICTRMSVDEFKVKAKIEAENAFLNVKRSDKFYNVICHGDLWSSNVLSNSEMNCVFIDYQMIKYCPPVVDLLFVIYMNSDRELRLHYMKEFTDIYFKELKYNLNLHNVNIENVLKQNEYLITVDYFKSTAIVQALAYSQLMLLPMDVLMEVQCNDETANVFYFCDRKGVHDVAWDHEPFRTRIRGLMEDLYEICASK